MEILSLSLIVWGFEDENFNFHQAFTRVVDSSQKLCQSMDDFSRIPAAFTRVGNSIRKLYQSKDFVICKL